MTTTASYIIIIESPLGPEKETENVLNQRSQWPKGQATQPGCHQKNWCDYTETECWSRGVDQERIAGNNCYLPFSPNVNDWRRKSSKKKGTTARRRSSKNIKEWTTKPSIRERSGTVQKLVHYNIIMGSPLVPKNRRSQWPKGSCLMVQPATEWRITLHVLRGVACKTIAHDSDQEETESDLREPTKQGLLATTATCPSL